MKKEFILAFALTWVLLVIVPAASQSQGILDRLKQKAKDKVNDRVEQKTDKAMDKALDSTENAAKKKNAGAGTNNDKNTSTPGSEQSADNNIASPTSLKVYANYDFVPGDKILFEDNFQDDQDGEFPAHWILQSGQAILNKINNEPAFFLTEGNYVRVGPRMKMEKGYVPADFTIEFDFYANGGYSPLVLFNMSDESGRNIKFGEDVSTGYFARDFSADFPGDKDNFKNRWHHAAMAKKGNQIKCYVDQFRVLVIPDCGMFNATSLEMGGIGDITNPIIFKNFRFAAGGAMNMIGKKFTDTKIVTHGINFDIDKSIIRPESMGTLNMVLQVLRDNPDVKFEIEGHTDNSGTAAHNLSLSQQRADAVKTQLVSMGVDPSRLTSKGFGDTKPLSDNNTLEGKANNRRVEFVKIQ
jgi:OmpA-OmpF porin, OOP family